MNIIVQPYGKTLGYCRPDTTWERENKDFYVPESVDTLLWTPVLFARISKAGKCIGEKFVSRYYDSFNCGALIYCRTSDMEDNAAESLAFTSCVDHTSLLPAPLYNPVVLEKSSNIFEVYKDGENIFAAQPAEYVRLMEEAICSTSRLTSLRIGDFVAVELAPATTLAHRQDSSVHLKAEFCTNELFDLKMIF